MTKKKLINIRELAAVLRESVISLVKPGPMRLMAEIGDHRYYRQRALELINLTLMASTPAQQTHYLEQAITLLGIAKHVIQQENVIEAPGDVVHVKIFEEPTDEDYASAIDTDYVKGTGDSVPPLGVTNEESDETTQLVEGGETFGVHCTHEKPMDEDYDLIDTTKRDPFVEKIKILEDSRLPNG